MDHGPHTTDPHPTPPDGADVDRRDFLITAGFAVSAAALAGCSRAPVQHALPFVDQPEGQRAGETQWFATTCHGCEAACGMLAKVRDGRPVKLEGNPLHPVGGGGLCAVGQAALLESYDDHRFKAPMAGNTPSDWANVDGDVIAKLEALRGTGAVRLLTGGHLGPTTRAAIEAFCGRFADARHIAMDGLSTSAVRAAYARTHGTAVLPHYRFDRADVIVSFDADFLGTWISPVEFAAAYQTGRVPMGTPPVMSHHVQFESRLSLTGASADERHCVAPGDLGAVVSRVAALVAKHAGVQFDAPAVPAVADAALAKLADRLWAARGKALLCSGSQDRGVQELVAHCNRWLRAEGATVDVERPAWQQQGDDGALEALAAELQAGTVQALIVAGANPVYALPGGAKLGEAVAKVPLVISCAERPDETSVLAHFTAPVPHFLERWDDAEPVAGVAAVTQPTRPARAGTRPLLETLAVWSGAPASAYDQIRAHWKRHLHRRQADRTTFDTFWDRTVHDGVTALSWRPSGARYGDAAPRAIAAVAAKDFTLVCYPKVGLRDGRPAHNPWLQELPDPISRMTWDNYACLSTGAAKKLGVARGDIVAVTVPDGPTLQLPVVVQPGQHDTVVAVALGYGRAGTERFATVGPQWLEGDTSVNAQGLVGASVEPALQFAGGQRVYARDAVRVTATGKHRQLAAMQIYDSLNVPAHVAPTGHESRPIAQTTTLAAFTQDPKHAGAPAAHHASAGELWKDDHEYTGHHWGLSIDLTKCNGCSACVIACQAENNVPVVGRDEIRRQRDMHWIRIDRYYDGEGPDADVIHQPMMCAQCDHAPCETVCPVLATVHDEEGLNAQVYNRCVGTRYCANNCPYKARRFNWFNYPNADGLRDLALNPDVTVRSRGVMEKCTFCVQRIQEQKIEARRLGIPLADGAILPACAQSCPAGAITFGDTNDPESGVRKQLEDPRSYHVLEELNVRPSVNYLRRVRSRSGGAAAASGGKEPKHG